MAYLHRAEGEPIAPETIRALAQILGLQIPEEDLAQLSLALRDQLASIDQLEALDLREVAPTPPFDVRWHD